MCWLNSLNMEQGIGQTAQLAMIRFILFIFCGLAVAAISSEARSAGQHVVGTNIHCYFDVEDGDKQLESIQKVAKDLGVPYHGNNFYFPKGRKSYKEFMDEVFAKAINGPISYGCVF